MAGWRKNTGEIHAQDPQRTRSQNRKSSNGNWQRTVPSWEKQFCSSVGSVPWWKLLEAKRYMYLYKNVVQWNDSAGEEAFTNAKKRFYAEINGLPCDISLPNPDKYIDEVNWNSAVDPELLSDLERGWPGDLDEDVGSGRVIFGNVLLNQSFGCTGWGDTEEAFQKDSNNLCPIPEFRNTDLNADGMKNSWDHYPPQNKIPDKAGGWGDHWNGDNWRDNHWNDYNWNDNQYQSGNSEIRGGAWDWNNQHKREIPGGDMSRYNISRLHGNDNPMHRGWRKGKGMRRNDLAYQQSPWIGTH